MAKQQILRKATRVYLTIALCTNATLSSADRRIKRRFPSLTSLQISQIRRLAVWVFDGTMDDM